MRLEVRRAELDDTKLRTFAAAVARAKSAPRNLQLVIELPLWGFSIRNRDWLHPMPNVVHKLFDTPIPSLTRLALRGVPVAQIRDLPSGLFPTLDTLILHLEGTNKDSFQWGIKGPLAAFSNAPALRRVGLGANGNFPSDAYYASSDLSLPWQQLTHILIFHPEELSLPGHHLRNCRDLRYLFSQLSREDYGEDGYLNHKGTPTTTLEAMESLTLHFGKCGEPEGDIGYPSMLDVFEFPNLRALRFEGGELDFTLYPDELWMGNDLVDRFLSKLSQLRKLTYLSLCLSAVSADSLRTTLLATPNVTTFDVHIYENYQHFFEALTLNATTVCNPVLPNLKTLVLEMDTSRAEDERVGEIISPHSFDAFLKSRLEGGMGGAFRTIIAYSSNQSRFDDDVKFVQVALGYVSRGLVFERRLVAEERRYGRKLNYLWATRDPDLHDWPELVHCW